MSMAEKSFRIAEIFGPTIQGEGRRIGTPCHFIRFAGCDYRCWWCDSPHAVLPEYVKHMPRVSEQEILEEILALRQCSWVVFSGGNPALFELGNLRRELSLLGYSTMLETQGTEWKDWIRWVSDVCVSPKPPSSKNSTAVGTTREFLANFEGQSSQPYLKIPIFDDEDYDYAKFFHKEFSRYEMFLSVGNDDLYLPTVGNPEPKKGFVNPFPLQRTRSEVLQKMTWLMEKTANDPSMSHVRVLPQMHVLAWGNQRGR